MQFKQNTTAVYVMADIIFTGTLEHYTGIIVFPLAVLIELLIPSFQIVEFIIVFLGFNSDILKPISQTFGARKSCTLS